MIVAIWVVVATETLIYPDPNPGHLNKTLVPNDHGDDCLEMDSIASLESSVSLLNIRQHHQQQVTIQERGRKLSQQMVSNLQIPRRMSR